MFNKFALKITESLVENSVINEVDSEIYVFGFKNGFVILFNIAVTLTIGFILGMPLESLLFLFVFIPLRSCAGGIHASNNTRCLILSAIAVVLLLIAANMIMTVVNIPMIVITAVVCVAVLYMLSPVQDANKPLDDDEIKLYKKRTTKILCAEFGLLLILSLFGFRLASIVLTLTLLFVCFSVCAGALKNKINNAG
ncbi:MAG: accessory gene regulator B family protein [Oscillospiraceae bacterium]|nr:accessory gene regulator B family protein [Oscillospiraceae bacterium]